MNTIEQSAEHYAKQWNKLDKPLFCGLSPSNPQAHRLATLKSLCGQYKIARSLRKAYDHDVGIPRYEPVLRLIDRCVDLYPNPSEAEVVVSWFRDEIAAHYGGVRALSLSSKILWFVYRSPVIIFDQLARDALETPAGDYGAYLRKWREGYDGMKAEIVAASIPYSEESWFHERVYDIHLWHVGQARLRPT